MSRGCYRSRDTLDAARSELLAWQECLPDNGGFTHLTSARIRGWPLPPISPLPVFASIAEDAARPRRSGLRVSRATGATAREVRNGLRVASACDTLLCAGRDLALLDLVVLIDAALHSGECTLSELRLSAARRRRGAPAVRQALTYADGRAESAWESLLRMFHQLCGVPVEPQFLIGRFRADLRIIGTTRLAEYDGEVHRDRAQHAHDLARERELQNLGWQRYGYTSGALLHGGLSVLRDADGALGRRHEPSRIRPWHRALRESLYTAAGRARVTARWSRGPTAMAGQQPVI